MSRRDYGSGSIRERGKNRWEVEVALGRDPVTGRRKRRRFTVRGPKKAAQRALREALVERDQGGAIDPSKITVGDYLDRWLNDHAAPSVGPSTLVRYTTIARRWTVELGEVRLADLQPDQIQAVLTLLLREGRAARTVRQHRQVLAQGLKRAVQFRLLIANPCDATTAPRPDRRELRVPTADEIAALEMGAPDDEMRRLISVAVSTGLRLGELLGLKWGDVDWEAGRFQVQRTAAYRNREVVLASTKTKRGRPVALSGHTLEVLREHRRAQLERRLAMGSVWDDHDMIFPGPDGRPQPPYLVGNRFAYLVRSLGLDGVRFHDLRHASATFALAAGVPAKVVSERLGHSTIAVTLDVYSHVLPDMQDDAAEAIEAALGRSSR